MVRRWLGVTLVSQAGAAIALSAIAAQRDPELGRYLQTIILGTVPFFEIVGPILIRQAVLRASEVPLAYAIPHTGADLLEQLRIVWNRAVLALGFDPWRRRSNADLTVQQIMRKNIHPLMDSFTFDEVLAFIEHSRDNTYPVVNANREVVGVIRYRELSQALVGPLAGPACPGRRHRHVVRQGAVSGRSDSAGQQVVQDEQRRLPAGCRPRGAAPVAGNRPPPRRAASADPPSAGRRRSGALKPA